MITAGTCRGTDCRFGAFSWSVIEVGGIWDITIFIKVIFHRYCGTSKRTPWATRLSEKFSVNGRKLLQKLLT